MNTLLSFILIGFASLSQFSVLENALTAQFLSLGDSDHHDELGATTLRITTNSIVSETIEVKDRTLALLGSQDVSLNSAALQKEQPIFNLKNSSMTLSSMNINRPQNNPLVIIGEGCNAALDQIHLAGDHSGAAFVVDGGKLRTQNLSISFADVSHGVMNGLVECKLGGDLELAGSTFTTAILSGFSPLFGSNVASRCSVIDCSFSNITAPADRKLSIEERCAETLLSHCSVSECTNAIYGGIVSGLSESYQFTSNNNTYSRGTTNYSSKVTISGSTTFFNDFFIRCQSSTAGAAIKGTLPTTSSYLNISSCQFTQNRVNSSGIYEERNGGAIYVNCSGAYLDVRDCIFSQNSAYYYGGAIYAIDPDLKVSATIFSENNASDGAAVLFKGIRYSPYMQNCTFYQNKADYARGYGGAIYVCDLKTTLNLTSCEFERNYAYYAGGAVYSTFNQTTGPYDVLFSFCTFIFNNLSSSYQSASNSGKDVHFNGTNYAGAFTTSFINCTSNSSYPQLAYSPSNSSMTTVATLSSVSYNTTTNHTVYIQPYPPYYPYHYRPYFLCWLIPVCVISLVIFICIICCCCRACRKKSNKTKTASEQDLANKSHFNPAMYAEMTTGTQPPYSEPPAMTQSAFVPTQQPMMVLMSDPVTHQMVPFYLVPQSAMQMSSPQVVPLQLSHQQHPQPLPAPERPVYAIPYSHPRPGPHSEIRSLPSSLPEKE